MARTIDGTTMKSAGGHLARLAMLARGRDLDAQIKKAEAAAVAAMAKLDGLLQTAREAPPAMERERDALEAAVRKARVDGIARETELKQLSRQRAQLAREMK